MKDVEVVIIGKNYSTSLGLIKAIGQAGYKCGIIKLVRNNYYTCTPELKSKYIHSFCYATDLNDQDVLKKILKYRVMGKKIVLIPADDYSSSLLDRQFNILTKFFYIPNVLQTQGLVTKYMDKYLQKETARQCGINTANFWKIEIQPNNEIVIPQDIKYPCFTKPLKSIGAPKTYIKKCINSKELKKHLNFIKESAPIEILIEEAIEVEEEYTLPGLAIGGNVYIPALLKKKEIGSGKHKGVTIIGEVIDGSNYLKLRNQLCELIRNIGFTGIFDIELLEENGKFYLNEINMRYSAAGFAVTAAGVNLPGMYIDYLIGKEISVRKYIKSNLTFISEKAKLEDFEAGYSGWRDYKKSMRKADIHFIKDDSNFSSMVAFELLKLKTILRRLLKK